MQGGDSKIEVAWGDGEHVFRLALGQLRELQDKCKVGPAELAERLSTGRWFVDDIREPIRLGLIGGGMTPVDALALVKRYVDERPLAENVLTAQAIVMAVLYGVPDDPVGKKAAAEGAVSGAETDASSSPPSTEPAPPSDSLPTPSTE